MLRNITSTARGKVVHFSIEKYRHITKKYKLMKTSKKYIIKTHFYIYSKRINNLIYFFIIYNLILILN